MTEIKTSDLTDRALDWAVASAAGYAGVALQERTGTDWYSPSTNWSQGGPIIEREKLCLIIGHAGVWLAYSMQNYEDRKDFMRTGPTPLIAAMRCYVASKLGDTVEIPDELL